MTIHQSCDIERAVRGVALRLTMMRMNVKDHVLVGRKSGIIVHTRLQAIFNTKFDNDVERSIHEIIISHALAAERLGPGGFDLCIEKLLEKLEHCRLDSKFDTAELNLSDILRGGASIPSHSDVTWVLNEHLSSASVRTRSMLLQALDLAGFAGRIIVEKAHAKPSVELVRGYTFDQSPAWPASVRFERPRIVCLDGFIETVSELHHLLEQAAESKEPVIVFMRGMSDDVKNTLKVNYDRGSLRVMPVIVKFDIEGINAINDIAVAAGADLVSSNKGDVFTNVTLSDAPCVEEVVVYPSKISITNTLSRRAVASHIAFLRKKRLDEKVDDVAQLFDVRIKALSPNHVVIRLQDDKDYITSAQSIDYALRAVKALVDHGSIVVNGKKILTTTAIASDIHYNRCFATLASLGAMIRT